MDLLFVGNFGKSRSTSGWLSEYLEEPQSDPTLNNLLQQIQSFIEYQIQLEGSEVILDEMPAEALSNVEIPGPATTNSAINQEEPKDVSNSENGSNPYETIQALIPSDSPIYSIDKLDELVEYIKATELIELDKTRKNAVPGVGDPNADLMVIGEAPGADEDEQGEPFVGRAGKLLTKILEAIDFQREDVYITNILKSRPTNNRDPLPAERAAHIPFLWKQIALIQPKLILCVGKVAGTSLLDRPKSSLKEMREEGFQSYHGIPVKVTYHPAALLRNPNWKKPTWDDVQVLRKKYDELGGK